MIQLLRSLLLAALLLAPQALPAAAQCCVGEDDGPLGVTVDQIVNALRPRQFTLGTDPTPRADLPQDTAPSQAERYERLLEDKTLGRLTLLTNFLPGSAEITEKSRRALDVLGEALNRTDLAPYRVLIVAHTDSGGETAANDAISQKRAQSIANYLIVYDNVDPERLTVYGLGERFLRNTSDPLAAENRRVEFIVLP